MFLLKRYCPHCAKSGLKTKVKKFKLDPNKDDLTIMCKNPEVRSLSAIWTETISTFQSQTKC